MIVYMLWQNTENLYLARFLLLATSFYNLKNVFIRLGLARPDWQWDCSSGPLNSSFRYLVPVTEPSEFSLPGLLRSSIGVSLC